MCIRDSYEFDLKTVEEYRKKMLSAPIKDGQAILEEMCIRDRYLGERWPMKQSDIYTEALTCLRYILLADHPEFQNWIDGLERDIQDWNQRREVAHHLRAYGGMGSFNDLPSMRGNHDYIFDFLKSVCYAFGHLYGKRLSLIHI